MDKNSKQKDTKPFLRWAGGKNRIVNFLEEKPKSEIKAILEFKAGNTFTLKMEPHVITTIKAKTRLIH